MRDEIQRRVRVVIVGGARLVHVGVDPHLRQLVGEDGGGLLVLHPQHDQRVEVATRLTRLGAVADSGLDVRGGLGVGGDLDVGVARLVEQGDQGLAR